MSSLLIWSLTNSPPAWRSTPSLSFHRRGGAAEGEQTKSLLIQTVQSYLMNRPSRSRE